MVASAKYPPADSDDELIYETRCIISTCDKPILQEDGWDEVCTSCRKAAKKATAKLKAKRLTPKKAETGLRTPQSEASFKNGSGSATMRRQRLSPLPLMAEPNGKVKKRKIGDAHDEIKNWRNPKSQKMGGVTERNSEKDFADQTSKAGTIGSWGFLISSNHVGNAPQLPIRAENVDILMNNDARRAGIVPPLSMITRSRSVINSEAAKSTGIDATELAVHSPPGSSFKSTLPNIQIPHSKLSFSKDPIPPPKPRNEADQSARNLIPVSAGFLPVPEDPISLSEGSSLPEDSFLLAKDSPILSDGHLSLLGALSGSEGSSISVDSFLLTDYPILSGGDLSPLGALSESEGSLVPEDSYSLLEDSRLVPEPSQHSADSVSADSTDRIAENTYKSRGDLLSKSSSMPGKGLNMPSTLDSTSPTDSALKQPAKFPVILSDSRYFTDDGIVQFQPFVPFIEASLDSIEPTLNPNLVQARRSKNPLGTEPDSLGFYDMLSKYRGSDEEFVAITLFDLRTEDQSYISIQAKIAARGGRKRQFGEVCSRLDVDSTWSKHQNQPWKINPAGLNRDDLPLQRIFGEFNAQDMVPIVVEGELHLTQHEAYEGYRRTWHYGDGGAGKERGYPEAQAGAWAHLAKAE